MEIFTIFFLICLVCGCLDPLWRGWKEKISFLLFFIRFGCRCSATSFLSLPNKFSFSILEMNGIGSGFQNILGQRLTTLLLYNMLVKNLTSAYAIQFIFGWCLVQFTAHLLFTYSFQIQN